MARGRRHKQPYEYRRLSDKEKREVVEERKRAGKPWHAPPHYSKGEAWYFVTAAIYEHRLIMESEDRRNYLRHRLIEGIDGVGGKTTAWVVLPNHYHALCLLPDIEAFSAMSKELHRGTAYEWNGIDDARGRQVWYRHSDREIRDERHYHVAFNYVHANPVKHGWVSRGDEWRCSSIHEHLRELGHEYLRELWTKYPPRDMGKGWDDF